MKTYEECIQFLAEQVQEIIDAASNNFVAAAIIEKYFAQVADDMVERVKRIEEERKASPENDQE